MALPSVGSQEEIEAPAFNNETLPLDDEEFPPLTLPPEGISIPEETTDPLDFPISPKPNTETKFTGQGIPVPEVVPTPTPQKRHGLDNLMDVLSEEAQADPQHDTESEEPPPITDFGPVSRDADQALLLQAARNAARLENPETALERFTEYLRRYPDDAEIRLEFAGLLSANGKVTIAAKQIEHLLTQFPDNVSVLRRYADMQMQLGRFEEAEPILDRLMRYPDHRIDAAIDLARVYANTNRRQAAVQIYEQILKKVAGTEPGRKLQFARLLLDIRRPTESLELLWDLHSREPLDMNVLQLLILASARSGNQNNTFEYIQRMQSVEPENIKTRYEFALQLFRDGFYRESVFVDQQILDFEPGNEDSLVRSAVAHLRLYEPMEAAGLLAAVSRDTTSVAYARAMASYHSVVGEHADAIAICRRVLAEDPLDLRTRLVLGDSYLRAGQLQRSVDTFARIANEAREAGVEDGMQLFIDATLSQARALAEAKRHDEALGLLASTEWPPQSEDGVLDTRLTILSKARRYRQAIQDIRLALADALGSPHREVKLRSTLGLMLARNGDYASAIQELSVVDQIADTPLPEAVYGRLQSYRLLGEAAGAERIQAEHLGPLRGNSYLRVRLAELATEDCDCCLAREVLQPLDSLCDANPLIANRLGDACLMCATCDSTLDCAGFFQRALATSPANVHALLGVARTLSRVKNFRLAYCYYEKAERYLPDDLDLKREIARMIREWKGPEAGQVAYDRAMQLTTTDHLVVEAKHSPELISELESEYASRADFGAIVSTEMSGKQLAGWMPLTALTTFEGVAQMEPHNQDAIFEIGQAFSQLNRTHCAIEQYERLLCINPCHREAKVALDRNQREISPQLHLFTRASSQTRSTGPFYNRSFYRRTFTPISVGR